MKNLTPIRMILSVATTVAALACLGCGPAKEIRRQPSPPLGSINDSIWQLQEHGAEAADFVVYQHEFKLNQARLNTAGEDHLKQVATRLTAGQDFQVVVERSMTSPRENTQFQYPIHPNPELDMQRREVIVRVLTSLGVSDAEERVVVAPSFTTGYPATRAAATYLQTESGSGMGGGGGGGGLGGGGVF